MKAYRDMTAGERYDYIFETPAAAVNIPIEDLRSFHRAVVDTAVFNAPRDRMRESLVGRSLKRQAEIIAEMLGVEESARV